ncbi:MAG: triose-phosphate isomerase [Bacteroidota bacterium]
MLQIIAGNWKMNKSREEAIALSRSLSEMNIPENKQVILFVPFPYLFEVSEAIRKNPAFACGAQNCHPAPSGAFTGEVSAGMIKSCGAKYVLVGHSERRQYFSEHSPLIADKLKAVFQAGLKPVYCCGESLEERTSGIQYEVILHQLNNEIKLLAKDELKELIVAYEPVWAIGTGKTASPEEASEMHGLIRNWLCEQLVESGDQVPILYGGSVTPVTAPKLFSKEHINGGLVGGASLKFDDFAGIVLS